MAGGRGAAVGLSNEMGGAEDGQQIAAGHQMTIAKASPAFGPSLHSNEIYTRTRSSFIRAKDPITSAYATSFLFSSTEFNL